MTEIERIAQLMKQTFEGKPYYGPSVLGALEDVTAEMAAQKPAWSPHSIWQIVGHLTEELKYAREVVEGTAGRYRYTWNPMGDTSPVAWEKALVALKQANRALVRAVCKLDDSVLDQKPVRVRGPFFTMLHGTMQHNILHAGEISLLAGQLRLLEEENAD